MLRSIIYIDLINLREEEAERALLNGLAGMVWVQGGTPKVAFDFTVVAGKVTKIEMIGDDDVLEEIDIDLLRGGRPQ